MTKVFRPICIDQLYLWIHFSYVGYYCAYYEIPKNSTPQCVDSGSIEPVESPICPFH